MPVVWKRLKITPSSASSSISGVGTGPPKVPACPKPKSSNKITTTLGASLDAFIG